MAVDLTYILTLKDAGDKTFVMPTGFDANVEIHCWGAGGGGSYNVLGGGGGYASTVAQIPAGSVVRLQIGVPGASGGRGNNPPSPGGTHPSYTRYRGGSAGSSRDEDADMGSGGGGGGASAVVVDNSPVCVGAGGGGAGGPGDDSGSGTPGRPGGVYPGQATNIYPVTYPTWSQFMNDYAVWGPFGPYTTTVNFPTTGTYTFAFAADNYGNVQVDGSAVISLTGSPVTNFTQVHYANVTVNSGNHTITVYATNTGGPAGVAVRILKPDLSELDNSRNYTKIAGLTNSNDGGNSVDAWASGGGGGGGYYGGQAGVSYGDDSGNAPAGNGGQNYGNIILAGSGAFPGGRTTTYYPSSSSTVGYAGYAGYIVMIFTRKSGLKILSPDGSGDWVDVINSYTLLPTRTETIYETVPPSTVTLTSSRGTWTVPAGVTSITVNMIGAGGDGNANESINNPGPGGGSGAYFLNKVISVRPGQRIEYRVGYPGEERDADGYVRNGGDTEFGDLIAGGGQGGHWRGGSGLYDEGPGAGGVIKSGTGGTNGTAGSAGGGSGGKGADSPFGIGGQGRYGSGYGGDIKNGDHATGYGAGGGGGGNNASGGRGAPGKITIAYGSTVLANVVTTGGWKDIQQIYVKADDNSWKAVAQKNDITLYNYK